MIDVAMFDEMDEGTAILTCTNQPPIGTNRFLTNEGLPTDHILRGERPRQTTMPTRKTRATQTQPTHENPPLTFF